jgi:hypothetical protein
MIYSCPICGNESGVTHGDQPWTEEVCEECLQQFGEEECKKEVLRIHQRQIEKMVEADAFPNK